MEPKDKAQAAAQSITDVVRALSSEAAYYAEALSPIFEMLEGEDEEEIAKAKAVNIEDLPPDVVRYWVATKDVLAREDYTLTFKIRDWFANPAYMQVSVISIRQGDIFGKTPIVAGFITSKNTQKLATRAELIEALKNHYHPDPVDYESHQIHGLEVLVHRNMIDVPDRLGIESLNAFQRALQGNRLLRRRRVAQDGSRSYGGEKIVLYQPQAPNEAHEFRAQRNHIQYIEWQEQKASQRFFEEYRRYRLLERLTYVLKAHIARTQ